MRDIFDFDDGDFAFPLSDDFALDSDGDLMFRMDDNMAMDMDSGDIHFVSDWSLDDDCCSPNDRMTRTDDLRSKSRRSDLSRAELSAQ